MRIQSYHRGEDTAEIDMTPMLDIVFIMLIFFIVTASFLKESGLPLNIPEGNSPPDPTKVSMLIEISETNEVWFGKRRIDVRAIEANLKRKMSELDNPSVVVRVHENAKNNTLIQVVDHIRAADIYNFVVIPVKE